LAYIPGLERIVGIGKGKPQPGRAGFGIQEGVDEEHFTGIAFAGDVGQIHFGGHALVDPGQFVLVDVHIHPHGGQVGDLVLVLAGLDVVPFQGIFLDDHTGGRREDRDRFLDLAGCFQLGDLRIGEIPVGQPGTGGIQQSVVSFPAVFSAASAAEWRSGIPAGR
jgi:hypothetical protein